jgi:hypothetical protein
VLAVELGEVDAVGLVGDEEVEDRPDDREFGLGDLVFADA